MRLTWAGKAALRFPEGVRELAEEWLLGACIKMAMQQLRTKSDCHGVEAMK
jgi:hypothetical protein